MLLMAVLFLVGVVSRSHCKG